MSKLREAINDFEKTFTVRSKLLIQITESTSDQITTQYRRISAYTCVIGFANNTLGYSCNIVYFVKLLCCLKVPKPT